MKWIPIFLALLFATQQAKAAIGFYDGNKLDEWINKCDSKSYVACGQFNGYIAGVFDAYQGANMMSKCVPSGGGLKIKQLAGVVEKWLTDHPELWHVSADELVLAAVNEAWPCPE